MTQVQLLNWPSKESTVYAKYSKIKLRGVNLTVLGVKTMGVRWT